MLGHIRRSTAVLILVFTASLITYVLVRPPSVPHYTVVTTPAVIPDRTPSTRPSTSSTPGSTSTTS